MEADEGYSGPGLAQLEALEDGDQKLKSVIETFELTLKLLENIANNPLEEKYRKVKTNNPKLAEVIFSRWPEANKYFEAAGFKAEGEFLVYDPTQLNVLLQSISLLRKRVKLQHEIYSETDEGIAERKLQEQFLQLQIKQQEQAKAAKQEASLQRLLHIDGASDFQTKVLNSSKPVIVDFFADWCPPCKKLAVLFEQELDNEGSWVLAKVKSDNPLNQSISASHKISGIPAVFLYYKGQLLNEFSFTGFNPGALQRMIQKAASLA